MPATRPLESPAPDILSRVWPVRCWFRAVRLQLAGLWGTRVAAMGFGWLIRVDREQRYNQLQDIIAILGLDELSEDDRSLDLASSEEIGLGRALDLHELQGQTVRNHSFRDLEGGFAPFFLAGSPLVGSSDLAESLIFPRLGGRQRKTGTFL